MLYNHSRLGVVENYRTSGVLKNPKLCYCSLGTESDTRLITTRNLIEY